MVFDTHTHAWGSSTDERPWVNKPLADRVSELDVEDTYTAETLAADMDDTGIDRAVLVGFPIYDWRDNTYVVEAVGEHNRLFGIGMIDPFAAGAPETVHELMANPRMLGFRLAPIFPRNEMWGEDADPRQSWLLDAIDEDEFWDAATETGALVQLLIHHTQVDQLLKLVESRPELTYVIDHFARITGSTDVLNVDIDPFVRLSEFDNVLLKASATPFLSTQPFPYTDLHDWVVRFLGIFGREQIIWGSDFPYISDVATYEQGLGWLSHVNELSKVDRRWITERSFSRVLNGR